jgi:hypothetical protein
MNDPWVIENISNIAAYASDEEWQEFLEYFIRAGVIPSPKSMAEVPEANIGAELDPGK